MINWRTETFLITSLKAHPKNPRELNKQQHEHLKLSILKFGLCDKPIINQDKTVIGGHQRLKILKELGQKEVECWVPDVFLDEKDVEELNVRLNRNHGDFDWDLLANEFDPVELLTWGFKEDELIGAFSKVLDNDSEEKSKKKSKKSECPNCGHQF